MQRYPAPGSSDEPLPLHEPDDTLPADPNVLANAFVVESTAALAQANAALRRLGACELPDPTSTERMLAFLRRAQGAREQ